jgi:hypothetical protein
MFNKGHCIVYRQNGLVIIVSTENGNPCQQFS